MATTSWMPRSISVAMAISPIGPAPEHGHLVAGRHVDLVDGLHSDAERFGQGRHRERHAIGHSEDPLAQAGVAQQKRRGQPTDGAPAADLPVLARSRDGR